MAATQLRGVVAFRPQNLAAKNGFDRAIAQQKQAQ
jgi:hypothetical protein